MQTVPFFEQLCCNGVVLLEIVEHPRPCQLEMEQVRMMTTGCKSLKKGKWKGKGKHQNQKGTRTSNTSNTDISTSKNCGRTRHWVKGCWRPGGGAYDNSNNNSNNNNTYKRKDNKKGKGKGEQVDVVETKQVQSICSLTVVTASRMSNQVSRTKRSLLDPGIHAASGARLQHDTCWTMFGDIHTSRRTDNSSAFPCV